MKNFATYTAIALLLTGVVAGLVDDFILVLALIEHSDWTVGSYHQPVLTALYLYGGIVCALLSLGLVVGVVRGAWRQGATALAGVAAMVLTGAVAGLWLPFIHVKEVDVAATGFRQAHYVTGTKEGLTFYNATSVPVTICLGSHGTCRTGTASGPLPASGLTLRPGQTADVTFPDEGDYPLTIVAPATTMTATDAVVQSSPPYCDENPSAQACICGTQGC